MMWVRMKYACSHVTFFLDGELHNLQYEGYSRISYVVGTPYMLACFTYVPVDGTCYGLRTTRTSWF